MQSTLKLLILALAAAPAHAGGGTLGAFGAPGLNAGGLAQMNLAAQDDQDPVLARALSRQDGRLRVLLWKASKRAYAAAAVARYKGEHPETTDVNELLRGAGAGSWVLLEDPAGKPYYAFTDAENAAYVPYALEETVTLGEARYSRAAFFAHRDALWTVFGDAQAGRRFLFRHDAAAGGREVAAAQWVYRDGAPVQAWISDAGALKDLSEHAGAPAQAWSKLSEAQRAEIAAHVGAAPKAELAAEFAQGQAVLSLTADGVEKVLFVIEESGVQRFAVE